MTVVLCSVFALAMGGCNGGVGSMTTTDRDGGAVDGGNEDGLGVASGHWQVAKPMPDPARLYVGVAAAGEKLFVVGGSDGTMKSPVVTAYDPKTESWETIEPLPIPLGMANVAGVGGTLYVLGALDLLEVYAYDVAARHWSLKSPVPVVRGRGAASVAVNGTKILLAGGVIPGQSANGLNTGMRQKDFLAYDTATDTWETLPSLAVPLGYAAGALAGDLFWMLGGSTDVERTDVSAVYDLKAGKWIERAPLPVPLSSVGATVLGGRIYIMGGIATTIGTISAETYVLDPVTDKFALAGQLNMPRFALGAATIGGKIYAAAGAAMVGGPMPIGPTSVLEVFVP